ncbi:hypothetical protein D3C71_1226550 [compost metagenome]
MRAANSAGVDVAGTMPCASKALAVAGVFRMALISRFMRSTMAGGVPLGASTPYHMSTSAPCRPASVSVGVSGSCGKRFGLPVAITFSLPAFTWGSATCTGRNI